MHTVRRRGGRLALGEPAVESASRSTRPGNPGRCCSCEGANQRGYDGRCQTLPGLRADDQSRGALLPYTTRIIEEQNHERDNQEMPDVC